MSEQGREPRIDPQPGELGDGMVDVPGGTEIAGGRDTGADAGAGVTSGTGPGGGTGMARDDAATRTTATRTRRRRNPSARTRIADRGVARRCADDLRDRGRIVMEGQVAGAEDEVPGPRQHGSRPRRLASVKQEPVAPPPRDGHWDPRSSSGASKR